MILVPKADMHSRARGICLVIHAAMPGSQPAPLPLHALYIKSIDLPTEREILAVNLEPNHEDGLNVFVHVITYYKLLKCTSWRHVLAYRYPADSVVYDVLCLCGSLRTCTSTPVYCDDAPAIANPWILYCKHPSLTHYKIKNTAKKSSPSVSENELQNFLIKLDHHKHSQLLRQHCESHCVKPFNNYIAKIRHEISKQRKYTDAFLKKSNELDVKRTELLGNFVPRVCAVVFGPVTKQSRALLAVLSYFLLLRYILV
ncbi:hypothetical protein GQX74_000252 [Glossina fuscipes]|nr:hypothetical protein GQX74_000252 [Glossina fuscipes]